MEEDDGHHENGIHATKDSDRQQRLRLCVLNEMLNTERDYVRTLLFLQSVSLTCSFTLHSGSAIHAELSCSHWLQTGASKLHSSICQFAVSCFFSSIHESY